MASDNDGLSGCIAAHASTAFRASGGMRRPTMGCIPVGGLPLFFRLAIIVDLLMNYR
jgi:hypothetical protein